MIATPGCNWQADRRHEQVRAALGNVWDPSSGLDVVSLGLAYDVPISDATLGTPQWSPRWAETSGRTQASVFRRGMTSGGIWTAESCPVLLRSYCSSSY